MGPDGNLYGTTFGTNDLAQGDVYGSVFKLTPTGTLTTLYSFQDTTDGGNPSGPLALGSDGNFYGTTITGSISGVNTGGTIYRITPQGAFTVLYSFNAASSGPANSYGGVVRGNDGNLYGTTYRGGTFNDGTVFQLAGGVLNVLHSFNQIPDNAAVPQLPLTVGSDGNLYGVASDIAEGGYGPESIFKVTPGGTYTDVFTFPDVATCNTTTADGCIALAPLTQHTNGSFYGTTSQGGANESGVFYSLNVGLPPFVSLQFPLGTVGSALGIFGQGFKKATAVSFGGIAATSFSVGSNSYLSARVPVGALYGPVTVTESVGKLKSAHPFAIAPTQNTFSPTSGAVGTPVTINGTGLTEAIKVTFGGVAATTFTVNSDGRITADVPTGAVTGKIVVINKGGPAAASATSFTVN